MRVKICGVQNEHDLQTVVDAGVHAVGFQVGQVHKSSSFILPSTAARLARLLPPYIMPVIVTHLSDIDAIEEILKRTGIYSVQLHCVDYEQVMKLRPKLPEHGKIILAAYAQDIAQDNQIEDIYPFIDAVLLDCYNRNPGLIGIESSEKTFEWRIGAEFIAQCPKPVILAGGLDEDNVADVVRMTRPFAVDACTRLKDTVSGACDQEKCREFTRRSLDAWFELMERGRRSPAV